MSQTYLLSMVGTVIIQVAFFAGLLFPLIYTFRLNGRFRFRWWESSTGRVIFFIGPAISGALLREVLTLWRVPFVTLADKDVKSLPLTTWVLSWLSLACIASIAVLLITLIALAFRNTEP